MSGDSDPAEPDIYLESEECPGEDALGFGDDLELNQFDGLPFSSRYYKLLKERKTLPVWKVRHQFEDALGNNQLVIVSGTAKTGRSTQVRLSMILMEEKQDASRSDIKNTVVLYLDPKQAHGQHHCDFFVMFFSIQHNFSQR